MISPDAARRLATSGISREITLMERDFEDWIDTAITHSSATGRWPALVRIPGSFSALIERMTPGSFSLLVDLMVRRYGEAGWRVDFVEDALGGRSIRIDLP